jgi:hypothetical protein
MAEPTLQEVFGTNATQTSTTFTITKADLGLTSNASTRAEQLFAAILKFAQTNLDSASFDTDIDHSIKIENGFRSYTTRNNVEYDVKQLSVSFASTSTSSTINPTDY